MNKYSTIILLLFFSLLFTGIAEARLTLGVVGNDDRVRPLANNLAQHLGEEVVVKPLADMATLLNWLDRFAMLDLAVLPSEEIAARPGRHLVLGKIGANGEMSLVTAQGGGGDLPRRLGTVLKESGASLWGTQAVADKELTKPRTVKSESPPAATGDKGMKSPEIVHLPALQPGKAWVPQSDATTRDILSTDALYTDKLVLGVVLEPGGPVQTAEQATRLGGYLQSAMQIPVTVRVFTQVENLTEGLNRYRMVDLAILRTETAASALEKNYRPLTSMFRTTTDLFCLALASPDLGEAVFNPLQAALVDMAAQEEGRKLLAEMGVLSVQPPGVLPGSVTAPEQTVVVAAPVLTSPAVQHEPQPTAPQFEPAPPAVAAAAVLPPELAEEPAPPALTPPALAPPRELAISLTTPVVTEPEIPASPANLERALAAPPKVAETPPAMLPGPLQQEVVLPIIANLLTVAEAAQAPVAPEIPALPEVPAAIEQVKIPETAPPVTIVTAEPAAPSVPEEPVVVAVVVPAELPTAPVSPPVEPPKGEPQPTAPQFEPAPPAVAVAAILPPELVEEPAPPAPAPPRELAISLTTPVVTEPEIPASPANLERALAAPPKVAETPPAMLPGPLQQEVVLPIIANLPTVAEAAQAPVAPEIPALPEMPAAIEQVKIPETVPPVTIVTVEPVAPSIPEEPVVVAVVVPAEPPIAPVSPPVEPPKSEPQPATATTEPPPVADQEELQRIVEELLPVESETVALTTEPVAELKDQQAPSDKDDITSMLGENPVVAMVSQPEIPESLRPSGIPVLRPGRIQKRATEEDERLLQDMPQPLKKSYVQPPPSLLPEPEPEPGVIYVIPFGSVMVPDEVNGRVFDQFVDILNQQGTSLGLQFVILKEGLQRVDPDWLAARKYVTGEVYAYVEDSGCCSTDLRTKARLTYRRPHQTDPAFGFEYPTKRFFDHDLSTLAKERVALADNIAQVLASELLGALKN